MTRFFLQLPGVALGLAAACAIAAETSIPLDRLAPESTATQQFVEQTRAGLKAPASSVPDGTIADLERRVAGLETESAALIQSGGTLENIRRAELRWGTIATELTPLLKSLGGEVTALTATLARITERTALWQATQEALGGETQQNVASEALQQLKDLEKSVRAALDRALARQQRASALDRAGVFPAAGMPPRAPAGHDRKGPGPGGALLPELPPSGAPSASDSALVYKMWSRISSPASSSSSNGQCRRATPSSSATRRARSSGSGFAPASFALSTAPRSSSRTAISSRTRSSTGT